jgi:hypothetical protein
MTRHERRTVFHPQLIHSLSGLGVLRRPVDCYGACFAANPRRYVRYARYATPRVCTCVRLRMCVCDPA